MTVSIYYLSPHGSSKLTSDQRPQSLAPAWNFTISDPSQFDQGYIFIGPYQAPAGGAYIYDKFGNLVWDGFGILGPTNAHDVHVCQYKGSAHLCVTAVNQQNGYGVGNAREFIPDIYLKDDVY